MASESTPQEAVSLITAGSGRLTSRPRVVMSSQSLLRMACGMLAAFLCGLAVCGIASEASGQEPLLLPEYAPHEAQVVDGDALPSDPSIISGSETESFPANVSGGCEFQSGARYWIVSSRNASQEIGGGGQLRFYARQHDGCLRPTDCHSMIAGLIPGAPVHISVHGSYVDFETAIEYAEATYCWIRSACPDRPINIIFYTWPSERTRLLLAGCELLTLGRRADANGFYLASLLACIPDCHPVCVLGHSHGARLVLSGLHLAGGGR